MDLSLRSIRKNIAALSVFAIIASMLVVTGVANAAAVDVYQDVNGGEWYEADVNWGLDNGVLDETQAYFRAADNASRAEFFTMVARGAALDITGTACNSSLFPDLDSDHWGCVYLTAMAEAGIISGDGAGSATAGFVRPNDNILRAEAAKVVVEAYQLTGTRLGSDVFTDVEVGVWFDGYVGIANENCVLRGVNNGNTVEPARQINRAESVTVVNRGANPTTECAPVVEAGALTVNIDGSTPDAAYIPKNGANIPYAVFNFAASSDEDINVEQVVITRQGLGLPGDFKNLKLYVDGVQKGSEKTVNTSTNTATFNLSSDPIVVPAGSSVLVEVRADMDAAITTENSQNQLCIATSDDVLGMGDDSAGEVTVGGAFAACGELMTTTSASVGTLSYTVTQPSIADINIGDTDVVMTKVKMDMAVEDVEVNRITFKQSGSASEEDFANVSLWMSGSLYADAPTWDGDYLTFDLSENPIAIAKGNSKTVELHTDVVGGLSSTAAFDVYRDWHIEGTGTVYNYGVNVVELGGVTPAARNIVGGNVAFSLSSKNPVTGAVKKGADDHEFTRFNVSTGGDGVTVRKISVTVNAGVVQIDNDGDAAFGEDPVNTLDDDLDGLTDEDPIEVADLTLARIDDVKIWTQNSSDEWYVVAGPNDFLNGVAGTKTVGFTDTFEIPASVTQEFMITADVDNTATISDTYDIDVANVTVAGNVDLEYLADGNTVVLADITGGLLNGNAMTVSTPQVDVTLAAAPGNKTYVRNTTDKDLVAFDFKASSADDIRITNLTVSCTGAGAANCSTAFSNLELFEKDGATLTKIDAQARSMSEVGVTDTVTFSTSYVIPKGTTSRLLVRGDLQSGAVALGPLPAGYAFQIAAVGNVSAEDSDSSAAIVGPLLGFPTAANTIAVAGAGTFSSQSITDSALQARLVANDSVDQNVLKVKFSADELEAWYVQDIAFYLEGSCAGPGYNNGVADPCADANVTRLYVDYLDEDGQPQEVSGTISGGVVSFEDLDIYIPAAGSQTIDVTLTIGDDSSVSPAEAGDLIKLTFNGAVGFKAVGASSATPVAVAVNSVSKEFRLAESFPVVTSNDNISTAMSTNAQLYSVTIAADGAGPIAIKQLCFDVVPSGGAIYTIGSAKLFRGDEDLAVAGEVTITEANGACGATGIDVLVQWQDLVVGGEDQISTSETYVLRGAVSGGIAGDKVTTTLIGDNTASGVNQGVVTAVAFAEYDVNGSAESFVWSDISAPSHDADEITAPTTADFLDGYLVKGLSTLTAHEVKY